MAKRLDGARIMIDPGDSPWSVAAQFAHDGRRWPEFVAANPSKPQTPLGTFATMVPGEVLFLPLAWLDPTKPAPPTSSAPAPLAPSVPPSHDAGAVDASGVTPRIFARALLGAIGAPITANNTASLIAWQAAEGGHWFNKARYNPLNTTLELPGSERVTTLWRDPQGVAHGVQAYQSWDQGLEATARTLAQQNMTTIRVRLGMDSDPAVTLAAIKATKWGTENLQPDAWRSYQPFGDAHKDPGATLGDFFTASMVGRVATPPGGKPIPNRGNAAPIGGGSRGFADVGMLLGIAAVGVGAWLAMRGGPMRLPGVGIAAVGALVALAKPTGVQGSAVLASSAPAQLPGPGLHAETNASAGDLASDVVAQAREAAHVEAVAATKHARDYAILAALAGGALGTIGGKVI